MSLFSQFDAPGPIFLMDGSAYIYRGFFANRSLQRSDGFPTGALVVVTRILLRILRHEHPRWFAFIEDGKGKNFRHSIYSAYKANREAMPEELVCQLEPIQKMVQALGVRLEISHGCEADDCIASLAERFCKEHPVVIISADKDLKQCLGPNVTMWDPGAKQERLLTEELFTAETSVSPILWADMQAVIGDPVDNIPGVPGIGPKTASQIFSICPGLEAIKEHFALLSPKIQKKLKPYLVDIFTWRKLTTLSRTECRDVTLDDLAVAPVHAAEARGIAREYELISLLRDIDGLCSHSLIPQIGTTRRSVEPAQENRRLALVNSSEEQGADTNEMMDVVNIQSDSIEKSLHRTVVPVSLLDTVCPLPLHQLGELSELPDCKGGNLAVIWPGESKTSAFCALRLAQYEGKGPQGNVEFSWQGQGAVLANWAAGAEMLIVADSKSLLGMGSCWKEEIEKRASQGKGLFDLGLAAYLFNPEEGDYSWSRLASVARFSDPKGACASPGALALGLADRNRARLDRDGLSSLYFKLELPLVPVLAGMENDGIAIDMHAFKIFLNEVQIELSSLTETVFKQAGGPFNIRSSQQLGELLFTKLGLPQGRKTKGGQASTSQEALEKLAGSHSVVDAILRYRKLEKMRSTYLEPLPQLTDTAGRLHTTFNQEATATGRLSSSNPNLQNIPVRGPLGKRMRSCFVAREGALLVSCDYSQIELRVLAHMSQEKALLKAFHDGEDIHARTAALIYEVDKEDVTAEQRRNAKTINFGLIYGMGAQKLAREIGLSTTEAKLFIARYFERFSGLKAFYERVERLARSAGFVTTLGGRRRPLPGIVSNNGQISALARRQAVNTVIQGSAADIIKMAMLAVWRDTLLRQWQARMVLQIHDELVLEVPKDKALDTGARVSKLMECVKPAGSSFTVPLLVDWGAGQDWGTAH